MPDAIHRVLFVCTGNICRSPLAEALFRHHALRAGVAERFEIDSAGTDGWHAGEPADSRAISVGEGHGVPVTSIARAVKDADFARFDVIVALDRGHLRWLQKRCPPALHGKLRLMRANEAGADSQDVPDPYYSGIEAFEHVYSILDTCCEELLRELTA